MKISTAEAIKIATLGGLNIGALMESITTHKIATSNVPGSQLNARTARRPTHWMMPKTTMVRPEIVANIALSTIISLRRGDVLRFLLRTLYNKIRQPSK